MRLELVREADRASVVDGLAEVLVDCVDDGASVGFLAPLALDDARTFWRGALARPGTSTWVARDHDGRVVGVVQLHPAALPNGAHRAEVAKLLVHRAARGRRLGAALLGVAEEAAARQGRWLLLLDTRTGSAAEALYRRCGWQVTSVVDDYAVDPDGRLAPCTFLVKRLPR